MNDAGFGYSDEFALKSHVPIRSRVLAGSG